MTSILSQNSKKIEGGPFGEKNFRKKSLAVPKKIGRGDPLVSLEMVWYAGKQEKPFWFSSLDQIVQFGAIIFCRTFKNYFGQFVWIEKKRKATIIVAFHFMKRRLKNKVNGYSKKRKFYFFSLSKRWKFFKIKILAVSNHFHLRYAIICQDICPIGFRQKMYGAPLVLTWFSLNIFFSLNGQ